MARNIGVLIRQRKLLPCLVHHRMLVSSSTHQTLTLSSIRSSTQSSSSTPKLPFSTNYNYHSLTHSRSLHLEPPSESQPDPMFSFPSNVVLLRFSNFLILQSRVYSMKVLDDNHWYYKALDKVKNERISAVFFYSASRCWRTTKYITNPIFFELCEQFPHITFYLVVQPQDGVGWGMELDRLGVESPTFHFYLMGEKVDELYGASVPRLKRTLANVYNPSGMKKKRTRRVDLLQQVEVLPGRFPASSFPKLMEEVEGLFGRNSKGWWFAQGLFVSQEKREIFSNLEDPNVKREWLNRELLEG